MSTEDIGTPRRPPPPTITQPSDENVKISFNKQFVTTIPSLLLLALTVKRLFFNLMSFFQKTHNLVKII